MDGNSVAPCHIKMFLTWHRDKCWPLPLTISDDDDVIVVELVLTLSILLNINRFSAELCDDVILNN